MFRFDPVSQELFIPIKLDAYFALIDTIIVNILIITIIVTIIKEDRLRETININTTINFAIIITSIINITTLIVTTAVIRTKEIRLSFTYFSFIIKMVRIDVIILVLE